MDIFKLIFEHDIRLDKLRGRQLDRSTQDISQTLESFLKPDPTYSKFYFTGTKIPGTQFGLNQLDAYPQILRAFQTSLAAYNCFLNNQKISLNEAIESAEIGEAMILSEKDSISWNSELLRIDSGSNAGHKKEPLAEILKTKDLVLYKEQAHHGFDLHLFSKENIYPAFFEAFQNLLTENFRFFSINGKRVRSERKFYFETWTLDRPPHGVEEVFKETTL